MKAATGRSLVDLVRVYQDSFAFGPEEMPDINLAIMEHRLNIDPTYKPVI